MNISAAGHEAKSQIASCEMLLRPLVDYIVVRPCRSLYISFVLCLTTESHPRQHSVALDQLEIDENDDA